MPRNNPKALKEQQLKEMYVQAIKDAIDAEWHEKKLREIQGERDIKVGKFDANYRHKFIGPESELQRHIHSLKPANVKGYDTANSVFIELSSAFMLMGELLVEIYPINTLIRKLTVGDPQSQNPMMQLGIQGLLKLGIEKGKKSLFDRDPNIVLPVMTHFAELNNNNELDLAKMQMVLSMKLPEKIKTPEGEIDVQARTQQIYRDAIIKWMKDEHGCDYNAAKRVFEDATTKREIIAAQFEEFRDNPKTGLSLNAYINANMEGEFLLRRDVADAANSPRPAGP